ncbi:MAG: hypothetical protein R3266_02750, partial [Gemmatimonadota bacterium]|nr:hypothetical protein [Gemmatimonadota bacterium]
MFELIVLLVIGVGLYGRRDGRWEWSRERLRTTLHRLHDDGSRAIACARAALPGLLGRCREDVRDLVADGAAWLPPSARKRLERGADAALSRARRARSERAFRSPLGSFPAAGGLATGGAPLSAGSASGRGGDGGPAWDRLQRRYLDGS